MFQGAAFILPELRHYMVGVQYADSFDVNLHKWLLVNFDCSAMWVKNATYLVDAFNVDRVYLKHNYQSQNPQVPDYRVGIAKISLKNKNILSVMRRYELLIFFSCQVIHTSTLHVTSTHIHNQLE